LLRQNVVKGGVEHANDLARLIAHDLLLLDIVERRNGEATAVLRLDGEVDVAEVSEVWVMRVGGDILSRFIVRGSGEAPAWEKKRMWLVELIICSTAVRG
jgi:hypothetical protein